jgi:hypothetical protein
MQKAAGRVLGMLWLARETDQHAIVVPRFHMASLRDEVFAGEDDIHRAPQPNAAANIEQQPHAAERFIMHFGQVRLFACDPNRGVNVVGRLLEAAGSSLFVHNQT